MTEEADRLRELLAISRAIASTTDYDEALHLVVQKACAFTKADACLLLLAVPGAPATLAASVGVPPTKAGTLELLLDERLNATLREHLGLAPEAVLVAVPMILRGDVRGTLVVIRSSEIGTASELDEEFLLSALADQAAAALGHMAHLQEVESALARAERERRAREELLVTLSAERSWLRAVIEHSPIPVLLVEGTEGRRVTTNARAEELFGRPLDPAAGTEQYAGQVCDPEGVPLEANDIPAMSALRGQSVHRELAIRRGESTIPVLASAAPIRGPDGTMLGAVVLYQDISAIKELERMRKEWTTLVAHDLRQPVNVISLRANYLEREAPARDPRSRRAIEHIVTCARRLDRMIDDLLDSSLLEARRLVLERKPRALTSILTDAVERSAAATAGHRIELTVADDLPEVEVDAGRIEQVLTNLLTNAVKYGDPNSPIEVGAARRDDVVEVTVQNHGPGMDPHTLDTVFERFQRGQTMGPKGEGLGLGLYISKGIVEGHGGTIWAESVPGRTTTFHFTLPVGPRGGASG